MRYANLPIIGSGTDADPFRPDIIGPFSAQIRCNLTTGVPLHAECFAAIDDLVNIPRQRIISRAEAESEVRLRDPNARFDSMTIEPTRQISTRTRAWPIIISAALLKYLPIVMMAGVAYLIGYEGMLIPLLLINESFDTADSDILGPGLTWTELSGDIDIVTNRARALASAGVHTARADTDLDSANHYMEASVTASEETGQGNIGGIVRKDSSATMTFYSALARFQTNDCVIQKSIAGSITTLATSGAVTLNANTFYLLRHEVENTDQRVLIDSLERVTTTDSDISGNLRTGIRGFKGAAQGGHLEWDNFEAGDLAAGGEIRRARVFDRFYRNQYGATA